MKITAGIHFTKNYMRIVFMNNSFNMLESLRVANGEQRSMGLKTYLMTKYPPNKVRFVVEKSHFESEPFLKIIMRSGYHVSLISPSIFHDPIFNLLMAVPKKTHFHKSFLKAAMLWLPGWNYKLINPRVKNYDSRQLSLF